MNNMYDFIFIVIALCVGITILTYILSDDDD